MTFASDRQHAPPNPSSADRGHDRPIAWQRGPFRLQLSPPGSKSLTNRGLVLAALAASPSRAIRLLRPLNADDSRVLLRALAHLGVPVFITPDAAPRTEAGTFEDCDPFSPAVSWQAVRVGGASRGEAGEVPLSADRASSPEFTLNLNNAGTATRFLTAAAPFVLHRWSGADAEAGRADVRSITIDGNSRMRERPIGELVELLRQLGFDIECVGSNPGCPPVRLRVADGVSRAGSTAPAVAAAGHDGEGDDSRVASGRKSLRIPTTLSSQFISALLQIGPMLPGGVEIELTGEITSPTYIRMTIEFMRRFGAGIEVSSDGRHIGVAPGGYAGDLPREILIEPDASSATYPLAAAAIVPHAVCTIEGLGRGALQGDVAFADVLADMGVGLAFGRDFIIATGPGPEKVAQGTKTGRVACGEQSGGLRGLEQVDMQLMPDAAMTLAVVAAFADRPTRLTGLRTLAHKETDRLAALETELTRMGCRVELDRSAGALTVHPLAARYLNPQIAPPVTIETYDDHRMAMAFAVAGLRRPNLTIRDPGCVGKTWPGFWAMFDRLQHHSPGQAGDGFGQSDIGT